MDVLPVDICCKVGEQFGCCRCDWMKEQEQHDFFHEKYNYRFTEPEMQLRLLKLYKDNILYTAP